MYCQICGFEVATKRCPRCGRLVCEHDWAGGICAACEDTLCKLCRTNYSISTCMICGAPVCENCSVRRGLGRVCKKCINTVFR
ncbi:MAG: hypothetical protein ABWK05_02785 [Pyrobaculum sp.]